MALMYAMSCIPNSVKLSRELKSLRDNFINVAEAGPSGIKSKAAGFGERDIKMLDYDGKLEQIIDQRDKYLKQNNGVAMGGWIAFKRVGEQGYRAITSKIVVCYNPFRKIKKYGE